MAKLQPKLSRLELRDLTWWFSTALVGGGIPNIIVGLPLGLSILVGMATVAALALVVEYFRHRRKKGVAIFVHLPAPGDRELDKAALSQVDRWMQSRHRTWFRAGPMREDLVGKNTSRAQWALETMRFRLDEAELLAKDDTSLFLYFLAHNPDAFALGSLLRRMIPPPSRQGLQALSSVMSADLRLDVKVHQVSIFQDKVTLNETDLSEVMSLPAPNHLTNVEVLEEVPLTGTTDRLALIVYAASPKESPGDHRTEFVEAAKRAASGGTDTRYLVEDDDICNYALGVAVSWDALAEGMRDGTSGSTIAALRDAWLRCSMKVYDRQDVPVRMFLNGSALVAFAAGAFLPPDSRLVPDSKSRSDAKRDVQGVQSRTIAIIDGDDVGLAIENLMLQNDMNGVLDASAAVGKALELVCETMSTIPGVQRLSFGGDSALFQIDDDAIEQFLNEIEEAQRRTSFRFSCGYGRDVRSAFIALRVAKTSGKNRTQSYESL